MVRLRNDRTHESKMQLLQAPKHLCLVRVIILEHLFRFQTRQRLP